MNLDTLCAQRGQEIVKDVAGNGALPKNDKAKLEGTITKSLGVLQEDGVYALFLFLDYFKQRSENKINPPGGAEIKVSEKIARRAKELLRDTNVSLLNQPTGGQDDFSALRELTNTLDSLLLARQMLEQMLIYARYHAKAVNPI